MALITGSTSSLTSATSKSTHIGYRDLVAFDFNTSLINSTQPGFVQMSLYGEHTWKLTRNEFLEMATELTESKFFSAAYSAHSVAEYESISDNLIPVYDQLIGQAPNYGSHWG